MSVNNGVVPDSSALVFHTTDPVSFTLAFVERVYVASLAAQDTRMSTAVGVTTSEV